MHLLFVTEEFGKVPSGVVTVMGELCRHWPEADHITILMNPSHWAEPYLLRELQGRHDIALQRTPVWLSNDTLSLRLYAFPKKVRIILRLLLLPLTLVQSLMLLIWVAAWMRRNGVGGILSHNGGWPGGKLNRLAIYAAWLAGIPRRVLVIHNTPWQAPGFLRGLYRTYGRMISRAATRLITVSNDCRDTLQNDAGLQPVDVIYNGISSSSEGVPQSAGEPPWSKRYPTIGFIGEIHPRKGVHLLMEALKEVKQFCELVLVGNGDDDYTSQIREMAGGLPHPVHFLGFRDDAQLLYGWMDIVVLPSIQYESFGMVIVEAMRAGVAVICSDFGGMKEVVADGETGLVVPAGDAHTLAEAVSRLLDNAPLRERMGRSGRDRMTTRFASSAMAGNYARLFHAA